MATNDCDINGKPWAKLSQLKLGDKLRADGGFTCIDEGAVLEIRADDDGELYVDCRGSEDATDCGPGLHYLDGQADDGEHLVGFYSA